MHVSMHICVYVSICEQDYRQYLGTSQSFNKASIHNKQNLFGNTI